MLLLHIINNVKQVILLFLTNMGVTPAYLKYKELCFVCVGILLDLSTVFHMGSLWNDKLNGFVSYTNSCGN